MKSSRNVFYLLFFHAGKCPPKTFAVAWCLWGWVVCDVREQKETRTISEPISYGQEKELEEIIEKIEKE